MEKLSIKFKNILRLDKNLLNRLPNCKDYTMFVEEDLKYNDVALLEKNNTTFFLLIKNNTKLYSYKFTYNLVSICRHGRALYNGPYTELCYKYDELSNKNIHRLFLPLINFLKNI